MRDRFSASAVVTAILFGLFAAIVVGTLIVHNKRLDNQAATTVTGRTAQVNVSTKWADVNACIDRLGKKTVEERIVDLPNDGHLYHVVVLLHDNWRQRPRDRALMAWFQAEPRLASLKAQVHFHAFTESDSYTRRHAAGYKLPAVLIMSDAGRVVWKGSEGGALPTSAVVMGDTVQGLFKKGPHYLFWWRRPKPSPSPAPSPTPEPKPMPDTNVDVKVPIIPDTSAVPGAPEQPGFPWAIALLVGIGAALIPVVQHFRTAVKGA